MCTVNMQRDGAFCFSIDRKNLLTCDDGIFHVRNIMAVPQGS